MNLPGGSGALAVAERSDLPVRVASALVMLAVAGTAMAIGGRVFAGFVLIVLLGMFAEWTHLVLRLAIGGLARTAWLAGGVLYLGLAGYTAIVVLAPLGVPGFTVWPLLYVIGAVIGVDVGAYFAGRAFGGPKIAPAISPSKTWSGLAGGMAGAVVMLGALRHDWAAPLWQGPVCACVAQSGDFFESWMKRRAGVKDSGALIPGHGGLFDRADGLIAVLFVLGVLALGAQIR